MGWAYNQGKNFGKKLELAWLDEYILRPGLDLMIGCKKFVAV